MKHTTKISARLFLIFTFITPLVKAEQLKSNEKLFREAISTLSFNELFERANALVSTDVAKAITYYRQAIATQPTIPQAYYNLGICLLRTNNQAEAITAFNEAIRLQPSYTKAHLQRSIILKSQGKLFEALDAFSTAVKHDEKSWEAHLQLGLALRDTDQFDSAINHLQDAIALNPSHITTLMELATTYHMIENPYACLAIYKKILTLAPNSLNALYNYGFTLKKIGNINEALAIYDQVLSQDPHYAQAHFSRSLAQLTLGNFAQGWEEYEWRWKAYNEDPKKYNSPVYNGSNPSGKTILIYAEQGLGDTLQFIRYGKVLKDQGAHVIAVVQQPLKTLLSQLDYLDLVITSNEPIPAHDAHCALMSMPLLCKTSIDNIPHMPYLKADPKLTSLWKEKLSKDPSFKIGICWQGNNKYRTQFLRAAVAAKSMQLQDFLPLATIPGVKLYNIQKITGTEQVAILGSPMNLVTFDESFDRDHGRFMDTAALMTNLDLVITIDTSIAHLAGGLGIPTWVLLPYPADWRWLLDRHDTPWYPNMRLFRQQKVGDWAPIMQTIISLLTRLAELHQHGQTINTSCMVDQADLNAILTQGEIPQFLSSIQLTENTFTQPTEQALLKELTTVNAQLWNLEDQLHQKPGSLFDPSFVELVAKAYTVISQKNRIKTNLHMLYSAKEQENRSFTAK